MKTTTRAFTKPTDLTPPGRPLVQIPCIRDVDCQRAFFGKGDYTCERNVGQVLFNFRGICTLDSKLTTKPTTAPGDKTTTAAPTEKKNCNSFKYGFGQTDECTCAEKEEKVKLKGLWGTALLDSYWICKPLPAQVCGSDAECDAGESCLPKQLGIFGASIDLAGDKYCIDDVDECDFFNDGKGCAKSEICRKKKPGFGSLTSTLQCLGGNAENYNKCFECVPAAQVRTTTKAPAVTTPKSAECTADAECAAGESCVFYRATWFKSSKRCVKDIAVAEDAKPCNDYLQGAGQTDACTCTDQEERVRTKGRGGLFLFNSFSYWVCKALPPTTCESNADCGEGKACLPKKIEVASVFGISITRYSDEKHCMEDKDECDSLNRGAGCGKGQVCRKKEASRSFLAFDKCEKSATLLGSDISALCYECAEPPADAKTTTAAPDSTKTCDQYVRGIGQPESCPCPKNTLKSRVKGKGGSFLGLFDSYFECKEVAQTSVECTADADCTPGESCVVVKKGVNFFGSLFGRDDEMACVEDEDECDFLNNGNGCNVGQTCGTVGTSRSDYLACVAKQMVPFSGGDKSACFECKGSATSVTTTAKPDSVDDCGAGNGAVCPVDGRAKSCNSFKYGVDKAGRNQPDECTCTEKEEKVKVKGLWGTALLDSYWLCRELPDDTCETDAECGEGSSCLPRQTNALAGIWGDLAGKDVPKYCLEDVDECDFLNSGAGCDEGQVCQKKKGTGGLWGGAETLTCFIKKEMCFECVDGNLGGDTTKASTTLAPPTTCDEPCTGRCEACVQTGKGGTFECLATPCAPPTSSSTSSPKVTTVSTSLPPLGCREEGCSGRCEACVQQKDEFVCLPTPCVQETFPSSSTTAATAASSPSSPDTEGAGGDAGAAEIAKLSADLLAAEAALLQMQAELAAARAEGASDAEISLAEDKVNVANEVAVAAAAASRAAQQQGGAGDAGQQPEEAGNSGVVVGVLVALLVLVLAVVGVLMMKRNERQSQNPIGAMATAAATDTNNNPTYAQALTVEQAGGLYAVPMEAVAGVENPMYASMA